MYLISRVSIPYRYKQNSGTIMPSSCLVISFQSPIGTNKTQTYATALLAIAMFQSPIGTNKTPK